MKTALLFILLSLNIAYSQNNYISLNKEISDLSVLDSAIKNHNVYFFGENHTYRKTNTIIEFKTLKYLNKKENVSVLLLEFGEATSWLVNQYFETGDEEILKKIKSTTNDFFSDFFENIYEYNKTIKSNKIITAGIDVEFNHSIAVNVLEKLIPKNKPAHDSIKETIEVIKFLNGYLKTLDYENEEEDDDFFYFKAPDYLTKNTLEKIITNFNNNSEAYKELLDSNYTTFKNIIEGVKQGIRWRNEEREKTPYSKVLREKYMYDKFIEVYNEHKNEKFFGQFGRAHTAKEKQKEWSGLYDFSPVAARINANEKFNVLTVGIYYPHYFKTYNYSYQEGNNKNEYKGMELVKTQFEDIPKDSILLYPIQEKDTFFQNKFDYLIVVNKDMKNENNYNEEEDYEEDDYISYAGFDYAYGYQDLDLNSYNQFFFNSKFSFKSPLTTHKIGFYAFANNGFYYDYDYLWYQSNTATLNDSTNLNLGGYKFGTHLGVDLIPSKHIHFIPQLGVSFMQLKTKITQNETITSQFFTTQSQKIEKATNRAFIVDLKASLKFTLFNFLALGVDGGYQFDFSADNWKYNKNVVSGLNTKFDGYFLMFSAGFCFEN